MERRMTATEHPAMVTSWTPETYRRMTMSVPFDIETRWPELFERLDAVQRRAVVQSLAAAWHEGWVPNREDVENLTDEARGAIDAAEYLRRARGAAERRHQLALARSVTAQAVTAQSVAARSVAARSVAA